jgi:hypothetical protein
MKKKEKTLTSEEWYIEFMEAVRATEETQTAKQFDAAVESAEKAFAYIEENEDDYSSAEVRRARRTMAHLNSLREDS